MIRWEIEVVVGNRVSKAEIEAVDLDAARLLGAYHANAVSGILISVQPIESIRND